MDTRTGRICTKEEVLAMPDADTRFMQEMNVEPTPRQAARKKVGRNDPCPCGSQKKFKKCCLVRLSEVMVPAVKRDGWE